MSTKMHEATSLTSTAVETIENLPHRIRDIATLRGLGYSYRRIAREFGVSPQAISVMLSRHRRVLKCLRGATEMHSLSARAVNALGRHGVRTREEAVRRNMLEVLQGEKNCGKKTRSEIERWLANGTQQALRPEQYPAGV